MNIEDLTKYIKEGLLGRKEGPPIKIVAVLLFGSWTKGTETPDSDLDLLVAAENINPKRQRRGMEITYIKQCLSELYFLDILLFTKEEVLSNFRNHNPLFLDIAEEGIIIFDDKSLLKDLISETRDYIKQRGIKRFGDGWIFPVEKGTPAYLSRVSNRDFS
jgi:predicted nucleotidyltransferase